MATDDKYLPYAELDTEKFIEWLNITRGNGYNAYDCTSDLSQTKNIAKKNFSVLFSGISMYMSWRQCQMGENPNKGSGNRLSKRKTDIKTQKTDYT